MNSKCRSRESVEEFSSISQSRVFSGKCFLVIKVYIILFYFTLFERYDRKIILSKNLLFIQDAILFVIFCVQNCIYKKAFMYKVNHILKNWFCEYLIEVRQKQRFFFCYFFLSALSISWVMRTSRDNKLQWYKETD